MMLHFSYMDQFSLLDDHQVGMLMRRVMEYARTGIVKPIITSDGLEVEDPLIEMTFSFMKGNIDREREVYERRVRASRENGKMGGRPRRGA